MAITPLTNQITAYKVVKDFNPDVAVDWAIEIIGQGHEGEYLMILAGLSKPTNYYEVESYLLKALNELGLIPKGGREGILTYSAYLIHQVAERISVKENLLAIHKISQTLEYESEIYDFTLLWWAWDDFKYEQNAFSHYWDGATRDNVQQLTIDHAQKWLADHPQY